MQIASALLCCLSSRLLDGNQFNFEYEGRVGGNNSASTSTAIAEIRRDRCLSLTTRSHPKHHQIESLDDLARAKAELEGAVAVVAAIELLAVGKGPSVMHFNCVSILCFLPFSSCQLFDRDHLAPPGRSLIISISKKRVASGWITGGRPALPYPNW